MAGTSVYPGALDNPVQTHTDGEPMAGTHAQLHNDLAAMIRNIELELGINPSRSFSDVAALMAAPRLFPPFSRAGTIAVGVGAEKLVIPFACTIVQVQLAVGTAPTGAAIVCDVNKNGTTIFTTQANRPQVAAAAVIGVAKTPDVTAISAGDYITLDVDAVGSTVAGSDLTAMITHIIG